MATQAASMIWPIGSMQILNEIDTILSDKRIKEIKGRVHMRLQVTPVINNNVRVPKLRNNTGKKI